MKRLGSSINYAIQGIIFLVKTQRNARFHLVSATVAIILGIWLCVSSMEWIVISLCITLVIGAEAFNTSLEMLCDTLHPEKHPKIKSVKDLSAAAVLILSIGALITGLIIFIPKLIAYFK